MKKGMITSVTFFTVIICIFMQLFVAHRLSTAGIELTKIEREMQTLERENESMKHLIASNSSLLSIESRAKLYGFSKASFYHVETPGIVWAGRLSHAQ
jgi:hypothetical protein